MEVKIEDNPLIHRIWNEWMERDRELSNMTKEERLEFVSRFQWVFPKKTKRMVELEALYSSVHYRHNREEFKKWFYVVGNYIFSRVHLGDNSYYIYKSRFKNLFKRDRCTSDDFPSQVLLVLAMLGYITELGGWYIYNEGSRNNHGYHYVIDRDKLLSWDGFPVGDSGNSNIAGSAAPEYVVSQTSSICFNEQGEDEDRQSWTKHPDWLAERQYESISSVEVVKEGLANSSKWLFNFSDYQYFYALSEEKQDDLMKNWISYQKLRDLSCGIVGRCLDDSDKPDGTGYAGRFYFPLTNMKSEHRHRYLRLDGEKVAEVDVSSAQPTFLGIMIYRKTGKKSEWLKQALAGNFYEWIKEKTNTNEDRKTIKKWMMQYMYSCYQPNRKKDYDKPHKPTYENRQTDDPFLCFQQRLNRFLKRDEPEIFKMIDHYKRNPEYREDKEIFKACADEQGGKKKKKAGKGKWCSRLSYDLVKMEVEYMKQCIKALPDDMKFWTIHDCLCVKESQSQQVKEIMEQVSREMYGEDVVLNLKRENVGEE